MAHHGHYDWRIKSKLCRNLSLSGTNILSNFQDIWTKNGDVIQRLQVDTSFWPTLYACMYTSIQKVYSKMDQLLHTGNMNTPNHSKGNVSRAELFERQGKL